MRISRTLAAFTGITAGLAALFAPTAQATSDRAAARPAAVHSHADDCKRVARADRPLCATVRGQFPYAYVGDGGGLNQMAAGRLLVQEIVHGGLTAWEERDALRGAARSYREHATHTRSIVVDLKSLAALCGTDGQFTVGFSDDDGRPGGSKSDRVEIDCP